MADASKKIAAEPKRIDANQEHECRYWSKKLGVSADQLKVAVAEVGPVVNEAIEYFARRQRKAEDARE
jgi:hypothetical protein